nr:hypothetical protein [Pseudomonas sp. ANT_J28]
MAGKTAGDDVDGTEVADVFELDGVWKSIGKDSPVDGVEFHLPGGAVACVFESDIKTSYACEQASNGGQWANCSSIHLIDAGVTYG